ncbi:hypothetical protein Efla_000514 [Eimeria flavescens]
MWKAAEQGKLQVRAETRKISPLPNLALRLQGRLEDCPYVELLSEGMRRHAKPAHGVLHSLALASLSRQEKQVFCDLLASCEKTNLGAARLEDLKKWRLRVEELHRSGSLFQNKKPNLLKRVQALEEDEAAKAERRHEAATPETWVFEAGPRHELRSVEWQRPEPSRAGRRSIGRPVETPVRRPTGNRVTARRVLLPLVPLEEPAAQVPTPSRPCCAAVAA